MLSSKQKELILEAINMKLKSLDYAIRHEEIEIEKIKEGKYVKDVIAFREKEITGLHKKKMDFKKICKKLQD